MAGVLDWGVKKSIERWSIKNSIETEEYSIKNGAVEYEEYKEW
jgi:hypothetical protein